MKKILMLLQKEFPPDIRVEKEAKALQKAGFEIHLLCRNRQKKKDEVIHGIYVDRLKPIARMPVLHALINYPLFLNPFWIRQATRIIEREHIDFIHAHDLPMVPLGLLVSRGQIPVFYDMHENYPAAMRIWSQRRPVSRWFRTYRWAEHLDNYCCQKARHIFVVVEEQKQRLVQEGIEAEKITVVGNRVETDAFLAMPIEQDILAKYRNQFVILYAGSFSVDRGLEVAIRAVKLLLPHIPNVRLVLVGDGPNRSSLEHLARQEQVASAVEFTGWKPFRSIPSYIRAASVCIVPQPGNAFIDTTIPHKLFQYMILRKPVLVSDARPLKRWVQRLKAGEVFISGNVEDFVKCALKIYQNFNTYYPMPDSELRDILDWKHDAANLISVYLRQESTVTEP